MCKGEFLEDPVAPYPETSDPPVQPSLQLGQIRLQSSATGPAASGRANISGNDVIRHLPVKTSQLAFTGSRQRDLGPRLALSGLPFVTANGQLPSLQFPEVEFGRSQYSEDDESSANPVAGAGVNWAASV